MNQRADSWKSNLGPIVTKPPKDHQVGFRVTLTGPTTDPPGLGLLSPSPGTGVRSQQLLGLKRPQTYRDLTRGLTPTTRAISPHRRFAASSSCAS
jgi:hypothetical protein